MWETSLIVPNCWKEERAKMTNRETVKIIQTEKECVRRNWEQDEH